MSAKYMLTYCYDTIRYPNHTSEVVGKYTEIQDCNERYRARLSKNDKRNASQDNYMHGPQLECRHLIPISTMFKDTGGIYLQSDLANL